MGLSDAEIEGRLAALRRRREALDREIADLVLYQELGRRLGAARAGADGQDPEAGSRAAPVPAPVSVPGPDRTVVWDAALSPHAPAIRMSSPDSAPAPMPGAGHGSAPTEWLAGPPAEARATPEAIPPAIAFTEDVAGARRYGRAVVEAACAALARAGRPLHAAEILDVLSAQGFTLPGRDPVAALNTRLWKRSGPGGPLRRVGEATYALATDPATDA